MIRLFPAVLLLLLVSGNLFAQPSKTVTVTSVTCTIEPMKTAKQAEKAQAVFDKYTEIRDLDLKGRNCNFTVAAGEAKAKEVLKALEGVGFKVVTLDLKPNQTFTVVSTAPKKEHSKAEELQKEKEVKSGK